MPIRCTDHERVLRVLDLSSGVSSNLDILSSIAHTDIMSRYEVVEFFFVELLSELFELASHLRR
jgi:hypothetical protein